jgi:hypothetical protein
MFSNSKLNMKSEKEKFKQHAHEVSKLSENVSNTSFLQFVRPGTAYDSTMYDMSSSGAFGGGNEDFTRPNTSWNKSKRIKPSNIIKNRSGGKSKHQNMMWFDRAERIYNEVTNTTQVLENVEYMCSMVHRLHSDFVTQLGDNNQGNLPYV